MRSAHAALDSNPASPKITGMRTRNVEPTPTVLSASMVPRSSSALRRTMARPRPTPPKERVGEPSTWRYGSNTCASSSRSMPMPLSRTTNSAAMSTSRSSRTTSPLAVNLMALSSRLLRIEYSRS